MNSPLFYLPCLARPLDPQGHPVQKELINKSQSIQKGGSKMILTPVYSCRNCKKTYSGSKQEIANVPIEKLVSTARYTLGSPDHIFRIGGKTIQLSDLHQCNANEIGLANFIKIQIGDEVRKE